MEQYIFNVASGLLGVSLGAYFASKINSDNRKVTAIEKMLFLVYPIGFKSWWKPDEGKPALIFHENYSELWGAYAALRAALPWWKRNGLDKAWQRYMVIDYYEQIPEDDNSKVFLKGTHKSREEAVERSGEFVRYLVELRYSLCVRRYRSFKEKFRSWLPSR
jgi:hypothetical protein